MTLRIVPVVGKRRPNGLALFPWRRMYDVIEGEVTLARVTCGAPGEALKFEVEWGALAPDERTAVQAALTSALGCGIGAPLLTRGAR